MKSAHLTPRRRPAATPRGFPVEWRFWLGSALGITVGGTAIAWVHGIVSGGI